MPTRADAATLNVQPRQRRAVYDALVVLPTGRSFKDLAGDFEMPETELREALRKLDAAGLAQRMKGTWSAIPLETGEQERGGEAQAGTPSAPHLN